MQLSPTITFRRIRGTRALEAGILQRLEWLERFCPSLMNAGVLVELAERHHREGNRFHVRLDLTMPEGEVVVSREVSLRPEARARAAERVRKQDEPARTHRDADFAIHEAFAAARRQLQDFVRRRRGQVKRHPNPAGRTRRAAARVARSAR